MFFKTRANWEDKNPAFKVFDSPENPCFRWNMVELMMATMYYYHVNFMPNSDDNVTVGADIIMADFEELLTILYEWPEAKVSLQIPSRHTGTIFVLATGFSSVEIASPGASGSAIEWSIT